jgi:hypothetical protein
VIARDRHDQAGIFGVGFIEVFAVTLDIAGEIDDIA